MAGDIYWDKVVVGTHADGSNGSTTLVDVKGRSFTAVGNAQISTAQSKFGGSSMLFDGSGDYFTTASTSNLNFGASDFTIAFWVRFTSVTGNICFVSKYGSSTTGWAVQYISGENNLAFYYAGDTRANFSWTPSTGTWYYIAINRSGTDLKAFVDNSQIGSTVTNSTNISSTAEMTVGALRVDSVTYNSVNGHIDDLLITNGAARSFSGGVPSSAFAEGYAPSSGVINLVAGSPLVGGYPSARPMLFCAC